MGKSGRERVRFFESRIKDSPDSSFCASSLHLPLAFKNNATGNYLWSVPRKMSKGISGCETAGTLFWRAWLLRWRERPGSRGRVANATMGELGSSPHSNGGGVTLKEVLR